MFSTQHRERHLNIDNHARQFWIFIAFAFGITSAFCVAYWLLRSGVEEKPGFWVRLGNLAAVWGPSIAGLSMARLTGGPAALKELFARLWRWPGHWKWWALAAAIPLGIEGVGALLGDVLTPYTFVDSIPPTLKAFVFSVFFSLISGPLGEEWGWRGFGLETGARAYGPLTATLIVGAAWSLWHLPAFVIPGLQDIIFPIGISFWEFSGFTMAGAVIISWLVFNARGAIAPAVIAHLIILMLVMAVDQTPPLLLSLITLALYVAVALYIIWKAPDLGYARYRKYKDQEP